MKQERRHYSVEEKVAFLRRHRLDKVFVSDLCEELGLRPTVFYGWQKEFFENGAAAFQSQERPHRQGGCGQEVRVRRLLLWHTRTAQPFNSLEISQTGPYDACLPVQAFPPMASRSAIASEGI